MKNKKKSPEEHGIISVIQSSNENESKEAEEKRVENELEKPKEHGIISIVQSPD